MTVGVTGTGLIAKRNPYYDLRTAPLVAPSMLASRQQRLDSVMRAIGHPLSFMRGWVEAQEIEGKSGRQEDDMAEQKAVATLRVQLEKSIEKLAARRDVLRAELTDVEDELKRLLAMLRAAGGAPGEMMDADQPKKVKNGHNGKKAKPAQEGKTEGGGGRDAAKIARALLARAGKGGASIDDVAQRTGQSATNAGQMLARMFRAGELKRVGVGRYVEA